MRKVKFSNKFEKQYQNRILQNAKLSKRFDDRLELFTVGISGYPLNDHALTGKLTGKRSFSVSNDIRVLYEIDEYGFCVFLDVGSHNQVYGK